MELTCIPHIHSSTVHFTSSWGKTSQMGQVSESLNSTWQLCAVGHGSHSPRAAPEHVRQAGAKLNVEITQRISRLAVKEGCQVARWFSGNFRLCSYSGSYYLSDAQHSPHERLMLCLSFQVIPERTTQNSEPHIMATHSISIYNANTFSVQNQKCYTCYSSGLAIRKM